jgi:hypothetical protein
MKVVLVLLFLVYVTMGQEAVAKPDLTPCTLTVNSRYNMTLSNQGVPAEACSRLRDGLNTIIQARAFTCIENIRHFIPVTVNHTIPCNLTLFDLFYALPRTTSNEECLHWHVYIDMVLREAAQEHMNTIRRSMGISDTAAVQEPLDPRQSVELVAKPPCTVGPYGITAAHWLTSDCATAQGLYTGCISKQQPNATDAMVRCFTHAISSIDASK